MIQKSMGERVFNVINITLLTLLCLTILYPYLHVLAVSLNNSSKAVSSGLMLIPKSFTLMNYRALLNNDSIFRALMITLARVVLSAFIHFSVNFMCAYALTRKGLPHKKKIIMFFFIPSYISGGLIPIYILYSELHYV